MCCRTCCAAPRIRPRPPPVPIAGFPSAGEEIQLSFAPLVAETAPAVVNVYASQQLRQRLVRHSRAIPFFEQFFGRQMKPRAQNSLGSGVIIDGSGVVVTNFHVIRDADEVKVALSDGREFTSKVLLKDELPRPGDPQDRFARPISGDRHRRFDALQVGDLVLAIGNPFGVGQTTTSGIVSALARSHIGVSDFGFFIQTDAAINPGNSGGALINMSRPAGRHQHGDLQPQRRLHRHRLRHSVQHRARGRGSRQGRQRLFRAALCRRDLRRSHAADCRVPRHGAAVRRADIVGECGRSVGQSGTATRRCGAGAEQFADRAPRRFRLQSGDAADRQHRRAEGAQPGRGKAHRGRTDPRARRRSALEETIRGRSPFAGAKVAELSPRLRSAWAWTPTSRA